MVVASPAGARGASVRLDGQHLTVPDLLALAHGRATAVVAPEALAALAPAQTDLLAARDRGAVYGANTGVGANRHERVAEAGDPAAGRDHALRLLRSHCGASGPEEDDATARAAMAVRLNQLLAGGSGIGPGTATALARALETGAVPRLHGWGSIGTADLSALAELGLTLAGERPWRSGQVPPVPPDPTDALPFLSSNAVTLATAVLALEGARTVLRAGAVVAALSFCALRGNPQAFDAAVHEARPHPGQVEVAAAMRRLVAGAGAPARIQDPFGLRALPQVLAPAVTAARDLEDVCTTEVNAAAENPLVRPGGVHHHGQFHAATLAAALDHLRATLYPVLTLSAARLGLLLRPEHTGLRTFLADGPAASSGLMIAEYVVQDVLAEVRGVVHPTAAAAVSISLGLEEHASFAAQGARALGRAARDLAPVVLAGELVAAVRALRAAPERLAGRESRRALALVDGVVDRRTEDHPLGEDLGRAVAALPGLAALAPDVVPPPQPAPASSASPGRSSTGRSSSA